MILTYVSPAGPISLEGTPKEFGQLLMELLPTNILKEGALDVAELFKRGGRYEPR